MCESRAEGGYRCKTHLERDRVSVDKKIHESIMSRIPAEDEPDISKWKPSSIEGETIMMVALKNSTVEAVQKQASTVRSAAVAKQDYFESKLNSKQYEKFLGATNPEYNKADIKGQKKLVSKLQSTLARKGSSEVAYSAMEADWKKVDEARDNYRNVFQDVSSETAKTVFYQSNPVYQKAREDFNYSQEGAKLNRERSMISVNGEIMNKRERSILDKRIEHEKDPLEKAKLNIELHRQQYLHDASTTMNQVAYYKDRSGPLKDGERFVIGGKEQWSATTIISAEEGKRIVAEEFSRGNISSTAKPASVLANKGLYAEGSLAAQNQISRIERESKKTLYTRAEKLEEALWV